MVKSWCLNALVLLMGIFFTVSCTPFQAMMRISPEGDLPERFSIYTTDAPRPEKWWEEFGDSELNTIVEEAFQGSFTLKEAWARLEQTRALAVQAGSSLYPDMNLNAGGSTNRQRSDQGSGSSTRTSDSYSLGLASSYELDLWGRIRSEEEAARLEAQAARDDLNTAAMTLAASVTEHWANIISQRMQKRLLEQQLETNKTYLELVELRFRKAMVSALDVYQQKQVVEQVRAQIPLVESQEQLLLHELALLLGKPPKTLIQIHRDAIPNPGKTPRTGLPAELLVARPDIRSAGLRLHAADWQVAAARANRLPAIRLSAQAGYGPSKSDLIFDNWLLSLAANLTGPLFDGKERAAEVDRRKAMADQNLWAYRRTVYTAIKEVEDALVREEKQRDHIKALESEINAARRGLEEAQERYRKGLSDYLPVLTQLMRVQTLERTLIQRQAELFIARVSLYRALGGNVMRDD